MRRTLSFLGAAAVVLALAAPPAVASPGPAASTLPAASGDGWSVLDNAAKQSLELRTIATFVPFAESFWRPTDIDVPNTGRYAAVGSGVTQPRGAGDIAYAYATLLTAEPDQESFGGVSRATMLDHTIKSIRHEAYTNALSGAGYNTWGGGTWQASLEAYGWGDAARLLWPELDDDTRAIVKKVITAEADILITKQIATGTPGNTAAEDAAWNAPTPALAAVMFPEDPHKAEWEQAAIKLAMNASSTAADADNDTIVDGKPVSDWMASVNLNDDLTIENHGFFNPIYQQAVGQSIGDAAIFYGQAGHAEPEAFSFRDQQIWDTILGRLVDENGDIVMPAGQDWISKDYQHLDYLSVLSTRFHDADASVLESRALETVAQRQAAHPDGSILEQPQLGYESMLIARMASAWWNHQLFGPSPTPTKAEYDAARAPTAGVISLPSVDIVGDRTAGASSYMSWDTESPMGLWIPASNAHPDDRVFTYYQKGSLIGSATGAVSSYKCRCGTDQFSSAGIIGSRDFSMTTFADGTTLLLDRGTGDTFTYSLESIPGVTGDRTVYSAGGSGLGTLSGTWVDVADRMEMVVLGGGGITAKDLTGTNNTRLITGSTGTGTGNRGALLVADVSHADAGELADGVRQPEVPDGWSALTARAPDGTDRLAVARWSGPATAPLVVSDERGAPVTAEAATIDGTSATLPVTLGSPDSEGETMRYFVKSDGPLQAQQSGAGAVLTNVGRSAVQTTTTYVGADGTTQPVDRTIAPGESVTARVVGGHLTLAGAEYEHLRDAHSTLADLATSIDRWTARHQITEAEGTRLGRATSSAVADVATAIDRSGAADPDPQRLAGAVSLATGDVGRIRADAQDPVEVRRALATATTSSRASLRSAAATLTVEAQVAVLGDAMPGEPATVRVLTFNRSGTTATSGTADVDAPTGWTVPSGRKIFDALAPGASSALDLSATLDPSVSAGEVDLTARVTYAADGRRQTTTGHGAVTVTPLFTLTTPDGSLPLASGGWNTVRLSLHNSADQAQTIDLTATTPSGVTASVPDGSVTVPANGDATASVDLTQSGHTSGTADVGIQGRSATGVIATATTTLTFSDNLAYNPKRTPYPAAFADSNQANYPPSLADDGNTGTFWVSGGSSAGQGPTPDHPIALGIDLGAPVTVGSVTMAPRVNYGPRSYSVQVSDDGATWTSVASVANNPNAALKTTFTPVTARYVRLLITGDYDATNRNVQVSELEIRPS